MGLIIHVADVGRGSDKNTFEKTAKEYGTLRDGREVIYIGLMCNGVHQVIESIKQAAQDYSKRIATKQSAARAGGTPMCLSPGIGTIFQLIITGHGRQGIQAIGLGDAAEPPPPRDIQAGVLFANASGKKKIIASAWSTIRPYFAPGGSVYLMGCHTGGGEDGKYLVSELSKVLAVPVHASESANLIGGPMVGKISVGMPDGRTEVDSKTGQQAFDRLHTSDKWRIWLNNMH
jgi:hypothetical protein